MSQMPSKVNIPVAVPNKTRKFYTQDHITTHSFMRPRPIFCREYLPNRDMQVKVDSFIRCNPMPVPIFGHAKVHNRAFFVPYRALMHDFNYFYSDAPFQYDQIHTNIPSSVFYIENSEFIALFISTLDQAGGLCVTGTSSDYDFVYYHNSVTPAVTTYVKLTVKGINYLSIIESLGYKINWQDKDTSKSSAMPLMAYTKVICDWYYPSAYVGDPTYNYCMSFFQTPTLTKGITSTNLNVFLEACLSITYNPDYFTNAWDMPTGPNDNIVGISKFNIIDITNNANSGRMQVSNDKNVVGSPATNTYRPDNGTPFVTGTNNSSNTTMTGVLTQYVLDALKSCTDYTKRHQLSGVRALDRYLSELGINLTAEIMNRSMYLGSQEFDMEFYDVFSHADTASSGGATLGAYAGKGNGFSGMKTFEFDNGQEFGIFLIVNSIIPQIGYYQGQHRETMHIYNLDFYHADFDHMAVQPISSREVYVTQDGNLNVSGHSSDGGNGLNSQIFGFAPKYIEYNTPMDLQTGLYRVRTRNGLLPLYSLMRDLSYYDNGTLTDIKHNFGFVRGNDAGQYNRIFYLQKGAETEDQMNAVHHFEVTQTDSSLPAYDTYEFEHEGTALEGKKVTLDINGSKLN